jgi:hypothetical protein
MTATTIPAVMAGIETRLKTITGLRTAAYAADQVNPPMAIVAPPNIENYRQTFGRGQFVLEPEVYVLVSAALDRVGQTALAEFASPTGAKSIPAAIEADRTLGGVVSDCVVQSFRSLGAEEVGVIGYYGGVFTLYVVANGT